MTTQPEILAGRYELGEKLGEGGVAEVYRAVDRELQRHVAVKILRTSMATSETARKRFHREARAMAGLAHPNVVTVHDAGEEAGKMFLVMEVVEGWSLDLLMKDRRRD